MQTLNSFTDIHRATWEAFLETQQFKQYPFLQYDFLALIEQYAATPKNGWTPKHQALFNGKQLVGFMPLYAKQHSFGEFVFDQAWAQAYRQHGLDYYPKLLNAIPFTPCPGPRMLGDEQTKQKLLAASQQLCEKDGYSSVHSLFTIASDQTVFTAAGLMQRHDCVFRWANSSLQNFDGYLMSLKRDKRKKIRQERRKVSSADITIEWLNGHKITGTDWTVLYQLYSNSYLIRGQTPYLPPAFFREIATALPDQFLVCVARHGKQAIAAAFYYRDNHTLYGRHWGASADYNSLHFELCYYQGIEYCIANGLREFDAGVQGSHKHARGFEATQTTSMHWIVHDGFRQAIGDFLDRETQTIADYLEDCQGHSALKPNP